MFNGYLERWSLTPDGAPIITTTSKLLPVRVDGLPAMLKIAVHDEEKRGGLLMIWWEGRGAAPVLAHNGDALLMERGQDGTSLADLARSGRDDIQSNNLLGTGPATRVEKSAPPRAGSSYAVVRSALPCG